MECIPPISFFIFYLIGNRKDFVSIIFLFIWELHYVQRAFIYPFKIRGKKQIPILIVLMGMIFNGLNSYIQGRYLFQLRPLYPENWFLTPQFIVGLVIFLLGYYINLSSDKILRHLRKPGEENGYKIPYGGLYGWISCPNYFGEMLEWIGWAVLTWSLGGLIFAIWTAANLVPRALSHHEWYSEKFPDYPKQRKAIIPFLI